MYYVIVALVAFGLGYGLRGLIGRELRSLHTKVDDLAKKVTSKI